MNRKIEELIDSMQSTAYPKWRNVASTILFSILCTLTVGIFVGLYLFEPLLSCYGWIVPFALIWLVSEYVLIVYMYRNQTIPIYVRSTIKLLMALSNVWFGLFVFGLNTCPA